MTQGMSEQIREEAIAWHIRLRDGTAEEWEAFTLWLEQNPYHSDVFDEVARADAAIESEAIPAHGMRSAANDDEDESANSAWRGTPWAAVVATIAAMLLVGLIVRPWLYPSDRYVVATSAGERRHVELGDGNSALLNGNTRLILDRKNPRYAEMTAGEATFTVRHDAAAGTFRLTAGNHQIRDLGTRFNVIHDPTRFAVAVIEGAVLYDSPVRRAQLVAGQTLTARNGRAGVVTREDPARFIGWQTGRLSYTSTPLEVVATDLSRTAGTDVRLDPAVRAISFTGSIQIEKDVGATVTNLAATLGLHARRTGRGWLIERHDHTIR